MGVLSCATRCFAVSTNCVAFVSPWQSTAAHYQLLCTYTCTPSAQSHPDAAAFCFNQGIDILDTESWVSIPLVQTLPPSAPHAAATITDASTGAESTATGLAYDPVAIFRSLLPGAIADGGGEGDGSAGGGVLDLFPQGGSVFPVGQKRRFRLELKVPNDEDDGDNR